MGIKTMDVSGLILTYNEASNIGRVLEKLTWLKEIVIVDSGSDDETISIVNSFFNTTLYFRAFDTFAEQCNFGLSKVSSPWVLSLDADYILSDELTDEIQNLPLDDSILGFSAKFKYCIAGKLLSASLYPPRTVLYRVGNALYRNEGHGHRIQVAGQTRCLNGVIYHDDRKPLSRWLISQQQYAKKEVEYLLTVENSKMDRGDRIRSKICIMPLLVIPYTLFFKRCLFDGWRGWFYVLQRTYTEVLISLYLADRKWRSLLYNESDQKD